MISMWLLANTALLASSGSPAETCNHRDFPMLSRDPERIASALPEGGAVSFRPINKAVKDALEACGKPCDTLLVGKGFLANGKSSNIGPLGGRVPVDERLSKRGFVVTMAESKNFLGTYKEARELYPRTYFDTLAELKASEYVRDRCKEQQKGIIFEGGGDSEPGFSAIWKPEGISSENPETKVERKNSICQFQKSIRTEKIESCDRAPNSVKTFDHYFVRYNLIPNHDPTQLVKRELFLLDIKSNKSDSVMVSYDQEKDCYKPVGKNPPNRIAFRAIEVFAYAFVAKDGEKVVYPDVVADYDILMFGYKKDRGQSYKEKVDAWMNDFYDYILKQSESKEETQQWVEDNKAMGNPDSDKRMKDLVTRLIPTLKPDPYAGVPLLHSGGWEGEWVKQLVDAFRENPESSSSEPKSLAEEVGLSLRRLIRHNAESDNWSYPNAWEDDKMHVVIWKDPATPGVPQCCMPTGKDIRDGSFLKTCKGLDSYTFFPHLFWALPEKKKFDFKQPTMEGNGPTLTFNTEGSNNLNAPFSLDMISEIFQAYGKKDIEGGGQVRRSRLRSSNVLQLKRLRRSKIGGARTKARTNNTSTRTSTRTKSRTNKTNTSTKTRTSPRTNKTNASTKTRTSTKTKQRGKLF